MSDYDIPKNRFTGIFIPAEILSRKDLSYFEIYVLSLIDSLYCKEHGGCYAGNDWFAQKLDKKENTIAKTISSLRSKGYIEDISFNGRKRVIRARIADVILDEQKKDRLGSKSKADLDETSNQGLDKTSNAGLDNSSSDGTPPIYTNIKDNNKDKREGVKPPKPPSRKSKANHNPKKIKRALHVHTTEEEHKLLADKESEGLRDAAYVELSLWKQNAKKSKWRPNDYLTILKWCFDAVKEKKLKKSKRSFECTTDDQREAYDNLF